LWRSRWNVDWQGKPKFSEKTCPSATFVHHKIPHDQTRVWIPAAAVGSRWLTVQFTPVRTFFSVCCVYSTFFIKPLLSNGYCIVAYFTVVAYQWIYMPQYIRITLPHLRHQSRGDAINLHSIGGLFESRPCNLTEICWRFERTYFLHFEGRRVSWASRDFRFRSICRGVMWR
jgi:hypothetical protein